MSQLVDHNFKINNYTNYNIINYLLSCYDLEKFPHNKKYMLILSNLIFLPISFKYQSIFFVFVISSLYHYFQCCNCGTKNQNKFQIADTFLVTLFCFYFIYIKKENISILTLLLFGYGLYIWFFKCKNENDYIYYHSLWHIVSGLSLYTVL